MGDGTQILDSSQCQDSDHGIFPKIAGYVTYGNQDSADYCVNKGSYWDVAEHYCDLQGGTVKIMNYSCPGACINGACVEVQNTRSEVRKDTSPPDGTQVTGSASCTDTDGGVFSKVAGTLTISTTNQNEAPYERKDYCFDSKLAEYHCDPELEKIQRGYYNTKIIECANGCAEGACLEQACYGYNALAATARTTAAPQMASFEKVLFAEPQAVPITINTQSLTEYNTKLYELSASNRSMYLAAFERKVQMLRLAEENPQMFLETALPSIVKRKLPLVVAMMLESEFEGTGTLEVYEKGHMDKDGKNIIISGEQFEYFVKISNKKYKLRYGNPVYDKLISGQEINVKGYVLDDYLVSSQVAKTSSGISLLGAPIQDNTGDLKIAIIKLRRPSGPSTDLPKLETYMNTLKQYIEEASYGQATVSWDVYGYYATAKSAHDDVTGAINAADPFVDFRNYSTAIFIDSGVDCAITTNCFNGSVGRIEHTTADGTAKFGEINLATLAITGSPSNIIIHEFGHNLGLLHANVLNCGNKSIDTPDNCATLEYLDDYDAMGYFSLAHYNGPHKETLGWLDGKVQEVTADGTYTIKPFTSQTGTVLLKVPRKKDETGKVTDYYHLEYRTAKGFDTKIAQERNLAAGPLIRIESYEMGGDTHLIDMSPQIGTYDEIISVGNDFVDGMGTRIRTISADGEKTLVEVTLSTETCIRNNPEVTISPSNVNVQMTESAYFDIIIKNNDSETCPDRKMYRKTSGTTGLSQRSYGIKTLSNSSINPRPVVAQEKLRYNYALSFPESSTGADVTFKIIDSQFGELKSEILHITRGNTTIPQFEGDMARKLIYTPDGLGKYVIDKTGKIYRTGNTKFSIDNGPTFTQETTVTGIALFSDGLIIFDDMGNVHFAGKSSIYGNYKTANFIQTPLSCNIAQDIEIIPTSTTSFRAYLMDEYGFVKPTSRFSTGQLNMPCTNWEGKTNAYTEGFRHANALALWTNGTQLTGYYILSKDGTIYACGEANVDYTKYVNKTPPGLDRETTAFILDQSKGLLVMDNYGSIYTTGAMQSRGEPALNQNLARDLAPIPGTSGGYAVLLGDGTIHEYR